MGVVAVLGGVGGGVLFVPIVSSIFPFHFDFVRGAGLIVALCGAIAASPRLLRSGMANMRLAIPLSMCGSVGSIAGAIVGLALPADLVQGFLGIAILGIVALMLVARKAEQPRVISADRIAFILGIKGSYIDLKTGAEVEWTVHRLPLAFVVFVAIGVMAGMFGLGAGWANVPAINLLMGAPLKIAVATSGLVLTMNDAAASWVYINGGAVLPLIVIPSVLGMMIGTRFGARLLPKVPTRTIRIIVISILSISGIRSILAGFVGV